MACAVALSGSSRRLSANACQASSCNAAVRSSNCIPTGTPALSGARWMICMNQPWKVLMLMEGCASRKSRYRPRAFANSASSTSCNSRSLRKWRTAASSCVASRRSHSCRRACISCAARRVKVMARISPGFTPASSKRTMRDTSSQVLPLPAQASTTTLCRGLRAMRLSMPTLPLSPQSSNLSPRFPLALPA